MEIGDEVPDDPGRLYLPIPLLLVFLALPVAIELVLLASDAGWISTPRLRQTLYQYGAFWAGLLDNWRPNYAAQPWLMFLTYSFLHSGFWHLAGNMLMLVILLQLNSDWLRGWTFVAVYVLSAFGGAIGFALLGSVLNPMVGASGALFGLVGAWRWREWVLVPDPFGRIRMALRDMGLLVGLNLITLVAQNGALAWETHLGGFVAGILGAIGVKLVRSDAEPDAAA